LALVGRVTTEIVQRDRFSAISGEYFDISVIASYAPILRPDGAVVGVAEIYSDLDGLIWRVNQNLMRKARTY
jgi:hypothetical protein